MRALVLLAMLGACGFSGTGGTDDSRTPGPDYDGATDGPTVDAAVDAELIDAEPPTCIDRWVAGPAFSAPVEVGGVNTSGAENDPWLTADERTLYFVRSSNVVVATRAAIGDNFGAPAVDMDLSSTANDSKVALTADGLTAFVNSARSGGEGNSDVWRATRPNITSPFTTVDQTYLGMVNDGGEQWDPHVSGDGLRLYLAPSGGVQHIAVATRVSATTDFGLPAIIAELQSTTVDNDPTLSMDERVVVFASSRDGTRQLHYALRDPTSSLFGLPLVVPAPVNGAGPVIDDGAHLSADGCRLYFTSNRGPGGDDNLWVATVQ